jgi:Flp pilus assembly protein TadG
MSELSMFEKASRHGAARALRRFAAAAGGQTSIEFALVCLPLFLLLFGVLQFAVFAVQTQQFATAVEDLSRNGATKLQSMSQAEIAGAICARARLGDGCKTALVVELMPLAWADPSAKRVSPNFAPQGGNTIMLLRVQAVVPSIVPMIGEIRTVATALYVGT